MEHVDRLKATPSHPVTFNTNGWTVFSLICVTLFVMVYIQQKIILTDQVYFNTWSQQLAYDRVEALLKIKNKWLWVGYIMVPLIVLLQVFFVTACLTTGALLGNIQGSFRFFFGIVLRCYPVLMLQGIAMLITALLFKEIDTVADFQQADYFSAAALIKNHDLTAWYIYPLKVLSIVEVLFWLLLSWNLSQHIGRSWMANFKFVAGSYGVGLLLWVLFIMFMQLNLA